MCNVQSCRPLLIAHFVEEAWPLTLPSPRAIHVSGATARGEGESFAAAGEFGTQSSILSRSGAARTVGMCSVDAALLGRRFRRGVPPQCRSGISLLVGLRA